MAVVGGHTNPGWALVKHHIQEQQTPIFSEAVNSANRLRKNRSLEEVTCTYFYRSLLAITEAVGASGLNDLLTMSMADENCTFMAAEHCPV